jgi:hypothetical protein
MDANKRKPRGFRQFDLLMRKLVHLPVSAVKQSAKPKSRKKK